MNLLSMIASLRKFGNFVVGLFPILGTIVALLLSPFARAVKGNNDLSGKIDSVRNKLDKVGQIKAVKAATPAIRRFYWKDYGQDRLDITTLPEGSLTILRPLSLVTVALCTFMPMLSFWTNTSVPLTTLAGASGSAPAWSIWLWLVAAALGWGCLLAGSAICNHVIFCFVAVIYITLFGACALFIPRSYGNSLLPLIAFLALAFSATSLKGQVPVRGWRDQLMTYMTAFIVGTPAGIYLVALTPMQPFFKPFVWQSGAVLGALIAITITIFLRRAGSTSGARLGDILRRPVAVGVSAWALSLLNLLFLLTLVWRSSLSQLAGQFISEMNLWNGYLWPVWYFIGIGIVFKMLKNTKVITKSIKEALPLPVYHFTVILLVLFAAALTWRSTVVDVLLASHFLDQTALWFIQNTRWFWREPINSFSAAVLKWVFLFDIIAILWLVIKRKWSTESAGTILYLSALSWFAVSEYMFQWLSFGRSPVHSIILLVTFAMWLIWLLHTVGLEMSLQNSRTFPSAGRLAIFGSIVVFALLEIHARCAIRDFGVMNEIFLYMFRGIIDVGFPYFLYVFACRRFGELPLEISQIFRIFCLGAVLTYPLNVLDKLALGGWTLSGLQLIWAEEITTLSTKVFVNAAEPNLTFLSIALRSAVFITALALVVRAKLANGEKITLPGAVEKHKGSAAIMSALAFASGFASFSKTTVDLPLPDSWRVLVAPFHTSLFFDYHLIALYLSAGIAALVLTLILVGSKNEKRRPSLARWSLAIVAAFALDLGITWAWPGQQVWLRSTGIVDTGTAFGGVVLVYLLVISVRLIENWSPSVQSQPLVSKFEINLAVVLILSALGFVAYGQIGESRLCPRPLSGMPALQVPARAGPGTIDSGGKAALFTWQDKNGLSTFSVTQLPTLGQSLKTLLVNLATRAIASHSLPDFAVVRAEDWSKYTPGAIALDFNYSLHSKDGSKIAMTGTTVLTPTTNPGTASYYSMCGTPVDMESRRYDLIRIVQASR